MRFSFIEFPVLFVDVDTMTAQARHHWIPAPTQGMCQPEKFNFSGESRNRGAQTLRNQTQLRMNCTGVAMRLEAGFSGPLR
jgi:hypothetical protein